MSNIDVMNQAQIDLEKALQGVMQSIQNTLCKVNDQAFKYSYDIKRIYDLIAEYRTGHKDPFYYNGVKFSSVEQFAKAIFGLSKSAFLSKVKVAREFCNEKGLPDTTKTKGLMYSALQDMDAETIAKLEARYNALPDPENSTKPAFSTLTTKSIRALKSAVNVEIQAGTVIDTSKLLPDENGKKEGKKAKKEGASDEPSIKTVKHDIDYIIAGDDMPLDSKLAFCNDLIGFLQATVTLIEGEVTKANMYESLNGLD